MFITALVTLPVSHHTSWHTVRTTVDWCTVLQATLCTEVQFGHLPVTHASSHVPLPTYLQCLCLVWFIAVNVKTVPADYPPTW